QPFEIGVLRAARSRRETDVRAVGSEDTVRPVNEARVAENAATGEGKIAEGKDARVLGHVGVPAAEPGAAGRRGPTKPRTSPTLKARYPWRARWRKCGPSVR